MIQCLKRRDVLVSNFLTWWQHLPQHIDPVFFHLGPIPIRYYGLMYIVAFVLVYGVLRYRIKSESLPYTPRLIEDVMTWGIIGVLLGGRLGYVLFYNLGYFFQYPWEAFIPFQFVDGGVYFTGLSGMSYHGGLIGCAAAIILFCRKHKLNVFKFGDVITSAVPLGYTFGRLGNFLNGELYGRVTELPIGMLFPTAPTYQLRHPAQLYEAFFEGFVLFVMLWCLRKRAPFDGFLLSVYIFGYGLVRFFIEFFRSPDAYTSFVWGEVSMGQLLCVVMMIAGPILGYVLWIKQNKKIAT